MVQSDNLDCLVEAFKVESGQYSDVPTPGDREGKRRLLRSLMNIRLPGALPAPLQRAQDAYLQARAVEKGIVTPADIPVARGALSLWQGDITRLQVDAIVNAANSQMLGCFVPMHSCIDNCIHTFAGTRLRLACAAQMEQLRAQYGPDYEQPTAVPMLTDGYNLPAKKVIHIVGPIVEGRLTAVHEKQLADCYANVLDLCLSEGLRTVAFCCISTGVFMFPAARAAEIAVGTVEQWLSEREAPMDRVIFNVYKDTDRRLYEQLLF